MNKTRNGSKRTGFNEGVEQMSEVAEKIEITYTELTQEQEQAMFNFFESRSFPRIIQRLEEEEKQGC